MKHFETKENTEVKRQTETVDHTKDHKSSDRTSEDRNDDVESQVGFTKSSFSANSVEYDLRNSSTNKRVNSKKNDKLCSFKRLLVRDLPFHQSSNTLRIHNEHNRWHVSRRVRLGGDWFHVLLRTPISLSILFLLGLWTAGIVIFAAIYMAIDANNPMKDCGLGTAAEGYIIELPTAFAFSLETATTVGYGLPGDSYAFFSKGCPEVQVTIYIQMILSMMFNAFLFSFFFSRLQKCESRGAQVLFSDKAIVRQRKSDGRWMFEFRLFDADASHPLVETHVRCYAIRHPSSREGTNARPQMTVTQMRTWKPNDELGGMLLASFPTVVSHQIDVHSPLRPKAGTQCDVGNISWRGHEFVPKVRDSGFLRSEFIVDSCGLNLREIDSVTGNRDAFKCAVCGETYSTYENLVRHIKYYQKTEKHDCVAMSGTHRELNVDSIMQSFVDADKEASDEIRELFVTPGQNNIEVLVVVEAIEPLLSGTFQAMQSYTIDDIVLDGEYVPCLLADSGHGKCAAKVDFDLFHSIVFPEEDKEVKGVPDGKR